MKLLAIVLSIAAVASAKEYQVGANDPLKTISAAAELAQPGDTITVHAGVYRERIDPPRGGTDNAHRITYRAAPGEKVVITGVEPVKGWEKVANSTWKVVVPNRFFDGFNPFADEIQGEWCVPTGRHSGAVYRNGEWLTESLARDAALKPVGKAALWFAHVEPEATTIWAQFPDINPNKANVEISKRQSVFYPSKCGINYITVRGFEMRQAATPWAGAMSEQVGLIGTHWSKGWIIEDNEICYSACTGVTLGRYELPKGRKPPADAPGFVKSIEMALRDGWSKEKIGSHVVRNNNIHHCEKDGIHGSLGACFSEIVDNEIHDIARTGWVRGADTAGIKFLGGVDVIIRDNHVYRCGGAAGIWLDWMAQGAVVTGNLLHDNSSSCGDVFLEMQHGPLVFANNILLSPRSICINSEGIAVIHNLIGGEIKACTDPRATPFSPAHAVSIAGLYTACGGDHRIYNNLVLGKWTGKCLSTGKLPSAAAGNIFTGLSSPFPFENDAIAITQFNPGLKLTQKPDGWYLQLKTDPNWAVEQKRQLVMTEFLGKAKISGLLFENPDGSPIRIDTDYFGKTRNPNNPFPGPFETPATSEIKVWPKP